MRDPPSGAELLDIARTVLLDELLGALPLEKRYAARLVANAMAIAARQLSNGDEPQTEEAARLKDILAQLGEVCVPELDAMQTNLSAANFRLARLVRTGQADSAAHSRLVWQHLLEQARIRVLESNPKYLGSSA